MGRRGDRLEFRPKAPVLGTAVPWVGRQPITLSSSVVLSVVALGVLRTGVADVLNYRLIKDQGPTAASMTNYLTPVVAVVLGIAVVDERLSWNLIVGTVMILVGLWIAEHNSAEREVASDTLKLPEGRVQRRERIYQVPEVLLVALAR
jgi:drug/metabolite transporter (DMT)-like permease